MNKTASEENYDAKRLLNKPETSSYGYENSFAAYYPDSTTPSVANQPLPGQPPLPPMPPPPGALPPLPHVFPTMTQVSQLQSWAHAAPTWQWLTPQATALAAQTTREITNNSARGNYARRDRFTHNRNNVYPQRGNFHRKNRRPRFDQPHAFDPAAYFGQALASGISIDWQRPGFSTAQTDALNHMPIVTNPQTSGTNTERQENDQDIKIVSDVAVKKTKQRKPMSQNYPSRPWNLDDAQRALKVENEYNKTVRAQSLIIKFPDPDLNKDIVREYHSGIQNIHFQSPSGPRYCFIQMAENVNIDKAIEDLEKITFGVGHLKVEKKSMRDEDYPTPEEIDPYTLYVGNLPESVNVNEVKSKFPTASRVDVGYAQKMRNTRYAFIRYTSVDESIAAYKKAHDLMWDTRSIIVRFRRQRGNTCLPGESKNNAKKVKEEPSNSSIKKETVSACNGEQKSSQEPEKSSDENKQIVQNTTINRTESNSSIEKDSRFSSENAPTSVKPSEDCQQQKQPWSSESGIEASSAPPENTSDEPLMITTIKEEPEDYDEMDMSYIRTDDEDDEDDEPDHLDESNDELVGNDDEPDDDQEDSVDSDVPSRRNDERTSDASDHLDHMFNELENMAGDIEL